jgi:predicted N-acetyltransferase YhbS
MYVRPSSRGLGVGRAILQRLIDDARGLGYRTIRLDSARFMREAHALYRRFGFVPSSPHKWEFESMPALRETAVFMRLDLGADQPIAASRSAYSEDSPDSAASRKTRDAMNFTSRL